MEGDRTKLVMQYMGLNFPDSFVISEDRSDQFATGRDVLSALLPLCFFTLTQLPENAPESFVWHP